MEDAKLIEKHLKEAHSLARENEMMQETRAAEECSSYKDLGLPSGMKLLYVITIIKLFRHENNNYAYYSKVISSPKA